MDGVIGVDGVTIFVVRPTKIPFVGNNPKKKNNVSNLTGLPKGEAGKNLISQVLSVAWHLQRD